MVSKGKALASCRESLPKLDHIYHQQIISCGSPKRRNDDLNQGDLNNNELFQNKKYVNNRASINQNKLTQVNVEDKN